LIMPANDSLFTSGTLGKFSETLNTVYERYNPPEGLEIAPDYDPQVRIGG
jgi:hypothetical protein